MAKMRSRVLKAAVARAVRPLWSSVAVVSAVLPFELSLASDECGVHVAGVAIVCDASGSPYDSGIVYDNVNGDFELLIDSGTIIQRPSGYNHDGAGIYSPGYTVAINVADGVTIAVDGETTDGIVVTGTRSIVIDSGADIVAGYTGLRAWINDATSADDVHVSQRERGSIRITDANGAGLHAATEGRGSATAVSAGSIESNAFGTYGLLALVDSPDGEDAVTHLAETGAIVLNSDWSAGLYSLAYGRGTARASSAGSITMTRDDTIGLLSFYANPAGEGDATAELNGTGTVSTSGSDSYGIWVLNEGQGDAIAQSSGEIVTLGPRSYGIVAEISNAASGARASVTMDGAGSIATGGDAAHAIGIHNTGTGASTVRLQSDARLTTQGGAAHGVNGSTEGLLSLSQSASSRIEVSGAESIGVNLVSGSDTSLRLEGIASAGGEYGIGAVSVAATGAAHQIIESTATVSGGWQLDVAGVGPTSTRSSAGVLLDAGGSAHLINRGVIGAASDRAVVARGGNITVDNSGSLTGFVEFSGGGVNVFNNASAAAFEVRHFADTDGDTVRDTKRVAISDFGSPTSTFNNSNGALVKLAVVENESSTDASGYYVPTTGVDGRALDGNDYQLNRAGIVQGQFVNLGTFNHAGVIDLRGPSIGNTLVITGAPVAGGAPGNGVFVSNGGSLLLNVVLNEGVAAGGQSGSLSDVLIVDGTRMGSGATTIALDRKEGEGALTPGNGILLVEVRNEAQSAPGVFVLDGDYTHNGVPSVIAGAYAYSLFHHGVGGDGADGNWYLRSSVLDLDPSVPADPTPDPAPPVAAPRFQPGVPLYESYGANLQALNVLPTLQQRVGNRVWGVNADLESGGAWGRTYGASSRNRSAMSTAGVEQSVDAWKMQLGLDRLLMTSESGGRLLASIAIDYGKSDSTVRSIFGGGVLDTEGYGVGTMWTWYGHTDAYVDVQAQVNRYKSDLRSLVLGRLVRDHDGRGNAFSIEVGKTIPVDEDWSVTPQTQLSYSSVRFDRFSDPAGAVVSTSDADSLTSRLGVAINRDHAGQDRRSHTYAIANLSYEWENGLHARVSGAQINRMDRRHWGEIGLGTSVSWNNGVRVYAEVSGKSPLRDIANSYTVHGAAGISVQF